MASIVFICPSTGMKAQGRLHEGEHAERFIYAIVECPACGASHLVDKATGMPLAEQAKSSAKDR